MRASAGQIIRLKDYKEADYGVKHTDLIFKLEDECTSVLCEMKVVRNKMTKALTPLRFDGDELTPVSVAINGKALDEKDYTATADELVIHSPPKATTFTLTTQVEINPKANTKLMGLYQSNGKFCTQCEAEGFRRVTYFPDRPDVLSTFTTRIEANKKTAPILLGNGNPVKRGKLANGRHYSVWHDPIPKPSYLFALIAGDLGSIHKPYKTSSGKKVRLGIYVEKGKEEQAHYAMDALIRSMVWDEEVFGCEYDLDVFNIVAVSDFNMGAMENKGLNIFNDKFILADPKTATDQDYANIEAIVAHEYFHNWTGNRITCRDWFQLCLKEGLTVFRDQEFSSDMRSRAVIRISEVRRLRQAQFVEDSGPLSHPVRPESYREINNFYTATVYEKGAEIVRMIRTVLGQKQFMKGMRLYLKRHDGDAATIEQFIKCFEDASKRDLSQFALWYSQSGTPSIIVESKYDAKRERLDLEIAQMLAPTADQTRKKLMHIPLRLAILGPDGTHLKPSKVTGCDMDDDNNVFHITKRRHKIALEGIYQKPAISVNRGFCAPVNITVSQSKQELAFLSAHDDDTFSRWQAFQNYANMLLMSATRALNQNKAPKFDKRFYSTVRAVVEDQEIDAAFKALLLTLPSESEISQNMRGRVNPDAVHAARNALMCEMGEAIDDLWSDAFKKTRISEPYSPDAEQAGLRSLANIYLDLGVMAGNSDAETASIRQFQKAKNMSDEFAGFARIVHRHKSRKLAKEASERFYKRYHRNPLVLDKWFTVLAATAGKNAHREIKSLMRHEKFSLKNPNRVRSVLASFAFSNPTGFHAESGEGYRMMADTVRKLDAINPQVAARMLTAFRSIRSMETSRTKQAIAALRTLEKAPGLSRDVSEILDRTLAG